MAPTASCSTVLQSLAAGSVKAAKRSATGWQRRSVSTGSDLAIKEATGRAILRAGPGGRSSATGHVVTVFGATGSLGRYVVSKTARQGSQVVIPFRAADKARFLRPMGDLGQIVPLEFNPRNDKMIEEAVRHSDMVYNCIGREWQTRNFSYRDVNVNIPKRIAEICNDSGVSRLVHVSCVYADPNSTSEYNRLKYEGEDAVRTAFPGATIVRPGLLYGWEGHFLHAPLWGWQLKNKEARHSPVHVLDVAEAMHNMLDAESTIGQIFDLRGPDSLSVEDILRLLSEARYREPRSWSIPQFALRFLERFVFRTDLFSRRQISEPPRATGALGFDYFDIQPDRLESFASHYTREYRRPVDSERPLVGGGRTFKNREFRIIQ